MFLKFDYQEPSRHFLEDIVPDIPGVCQESQTGKCNFHLDHYKENGEKLVHACVPCFLLRYVLVEHKVGNSSAGAMACPWPPETLLSQNTGDGVASLNAQHQFEEKYKDVLSYSSEVACSKKPKDCSCQDEDYWIWTLGERFCRKCSDDIPCICHMWEEWMYEDFVDFCPAWIHPNSQNLSTNAHEDVNYSDEPFLDNMNNSEDSTNFCNERRGLYEDGFSSDDQSNSENFYEDQNLDSDW